jgi:hypothetical protein
MRPFSLRGRKALLITGAVTLIILAVAVVRAVIDSGEPLESSYAGTIGAGPAKAAVFSLRNVSEREISFRVLRVSYRYRGKEWSITTPSPGLKYPRYVRPDAQVDYPVLLQTEDGGPITGPFEVGISYSTTKKNFVASLPGGEAISNALSMPLGKSVRGVHWIEAVAP